MRHSSSSTPSRRDLDVISTDVDLAIERLLAGGLVAVPTETVYGLAADARQPHAVARIFEVKGRPSNHPLIVHIVNADRLDDWAADVPAAARALAAAAWPGPLTMLLRRAAGVHDSVTGGRATIGLRVPSHPLTRAVLHELNSGIAAPSANRFGRVSPTTAEHVLADIGDRLDPDRDLILDGGPCEIGVESTIVDLTVAPPQVLRAGAITAETIERLTGIETGVASGPTRAAGMLASHYAPTCAVELATDRSSGHDRVRMHRSAGRRAELLDRTDDLVVAAQRLYDDLRAADIASLDVLVAVLPAENGLGHAIRDRLTKAASASDPDSSSRAD